MISEPEDGKIVFRKPTKRTSEEKSDFKSSTFKKSKKNKSESKEKEKVKGICNKKLLSFNEDEDEDDEG